MRTTLDLDGPVLREAKRLAKREGKSIGRVVSELLAVALAGRGDETAERAPEWISKPMGARVELDDREALYATMEEPDTNRIAEES